MNVYAAVKQAMQDLIAPQLESLRGDVKALGAEMHGELASVRAEIGGLRTEMHSELASVRAEIGGLRTEMHGELASVRADIRRLDDKITIALDVRERIVALETKVGL